MQFRFLLLLRANMEGTNDGLLFSDNEMHTQTLHKDLK